jgi:hypothetical protein
MSASFQRLGPLGKVSKTSGGGRPRSEDCYGKFEMEDIEAIDSVPGTARAKALALDLWWTALGHQPRVRIPARIDLSPSCRAELTRRADALSAGGMASDLAWADAMVKAMPSRRFSDPGWLMRNRRYTEAAVENFHNDLETGAICSPATAPNGSATRSESSSAKGDGRRPLATSSPHPFDNVLRRGIGAVGQTARGPAPGTTHANMCS